MYADQLHILFGRHQTKTQSVIGPSRQARNLAKYGFAAARQHPLETYGPEAVKTGDKCFTPQPLARAIVTTHLQKLWSDLSLP